MAQLKWDFINPVNYGTANQLYQQGNEQISKAIQGAGQAVIGYGEGIKKQQTDDILNALYQAQSPDQLSGAMANVAALQQRYGRGFDQAAVRKEVDARGQTLNQQALGQIQLTQAQNQQAAIPIQNQAAIAHAKTLGLDTSALEQLGNLNVDASGQINNAITGLVQQSRYKVDDAYRDKVYDRGVVTSDRDYELAEAGSRRADISTAASVAGNFVTPSVSGVRVNPETGKLEGYTSEGTSFGGAFGSVMDNLFHTESRNRHTNRDGSLIRSPKGALGIAQIMPATAAKPGYGMQPIDLKSTSPDQQKAWANEYINRISKHHNFTIEQGVAAYNAGPGAVEKAIAAGGANWLSKLPKETRDYVPKVMGGASAGGQRSGGGGSVAGANSAVSSGGVISQADFASMKGSYASKKVELDKKYSTTESKDGISNSIIGGGTTVAQWQAKQKDGALFGLLRGDSQNVIDAAKGNPAYQKLPEELKVKVLEDTSAWLENKEGWLGSNGTTKELKARINNTIRQYNTAKTQDYTMQKKALFEAEYQDAVTKFTAAGSAAPSREAMMEILDPDLYKATYGKKEAQKAVASVAKPKAAATTTPVAAVTPAAKQAQAIKNTKVAEAAKKAESAKAAREKANAAVAKARQLSDKLAKEKAASNTKAAKPSKQELAKYFADKGVNSKVVPNGINPKEDRAMIREAREAATKLVAKREQEAAAKKEATSKMRAAERARIAKEFSDQQARKAREAQKKREEELRKKDKFHGLVK